MADGGYAAKNGAREAPIHRVKADGMTMGDDFPILCETCLGQNPYVRMVKLPFGQKLCKISGAPYQAFRWKAGPHGRHKETIISHAVAAQRNICQTCLNDMKYGLPVGVRDAILEREESQKMKLPTSDVGSRYFYEQQSVLGIENSADAVPASFALDVANHAASKQLESFSRTVHGAGQVTQRSSNSRSSSSEQAASGLTATSAGMDFKSATAFRNLPKLCSFWLNGACNRVSRKTCPFRPCCGSFVFPEIAGSDREACTKLVNDLRTNGPAEVMKHLDPVVRAAIQAALRGNRDNAIRQRVSGDDSLTKKYLNRMTTLNRHIQPPDDPTVTTLWLGNIDCEQVSEAELGGLLYSYGSIVAIHIVRGANCAFVEFSSRDIAENAARLMHNSLVIKGNQINVNWAKPKSQASCQASEHISGPSAGEAMPAPPGLERLPVSVYSLGNMATPILPPPPPPPPSGPPPNANFAGSGCKRKIEEADISTQKRTSYPSTNPTRLGANPSMKQN